MKMKAPLIALLVPVAVLAACNRADTNADADGIGESTETPAAATGNGYTAPDSLNNAAGAPNATATPNGTGTVEGTVTTPSDGAVSSEPGTPMTPPAGATDGTGSMPADSAGHPKRPSDG